VSQRDVDPDGVAAVSDPGWRRLRRSDIRQFVLYGLNGAFAAVVYTIVVWLLLAVSHKTFVLDVLIAYAAGGVCNYTGARRLFKPVTKLSGHLGRYLIVVAAAFGLTSLLAWLLNRAGAPDVLGAYVPVIVTAIPTFIAMRFWVFRPAPLEDR
jgi:putative flippase GtrA